MATPAPFLALADWNTTAADLRPLAARMDARVFTGRGPDHALGSGVQLLDDPVVLPKGKHSDHHPIVFPFEVHGHPFTAGLWNVHQGAPPMWVRNRLRAMIRRFEPHAFVLNEAYRQGDALDDLHRYRLLQGQNRGEHADVALLIRRDLKVTHEGPVELEHPWMVRRYNTWREPRVYRRARIQLAPGVPLRLLGAHVPTDAPINEDARRESDDRVARWANPKENR